MDCGQKDGRTTSKQYTPQIQFAGGGVHGLRTEGWKDNVKTVYPPNTVCRGGGGGGGGVEKIDMKY